MAVSDTLIVYGFMIMIVSMDMDKVKREGQSSAMVEQVATRGRIIKRNSNLCPYSYLVLDLRIEYKGP